MEERYLSKNMVNFLCEDCGLPFKVIQGSRQRFCPSCIEKRVKQGRPKKVLGFSKSKQIGK